MGTIQVIRQNLVPNPKATVDTTGWIATSTISSTTPSGTLTRSTTQGRSSSTSFAVTPAGLGGFLKTSKMPYSFGSWVLSAYFKLTSGTWSGTMFQTYYDAAGTYLGSQNGSSYTGSASAWTRAVCSVGPSPYATATQCEFVISVQSFAEFFVTDCLMESGSTAYAFFDGDGADAYLLYATLNTGWYGTANASSSWAEFGVASAQNLGSVLDGPDVLGF